MDTPPVLFAEKGGEQSAAQITAFDDTWHWGMESEETYHEVIMQGGKLAEVVSAFRLFLGQNDMMAYLVMMAARLKELRRVLKSNGTLFLHCDSTASHYLKIILDAVFGPWAFVNEIVWKRTHSHGNVGRTFGSVFDTIFFYAKDRRYVWNKQYTPFDEDYIKRRFSYKDPDGRRWQSVTLRNPGMRPNLHYPYTASNGITYYPHPNGWSCDEARMSKYDRQGRLHFPSKPDGQLRLKMYLDETSGAQLQNVWDDIPPINSQAQERLGYPTQKPEALLERIITACSNEGDVVMDPFCGCGTAIAVAERLNRRWIGIDITHLAITLIRHRLMSAFDKELSEYEVIGDPKDLHGARALALEDRYQFQFWALGLVGAQPEDERKRGADQGIDGVIRFIDDKSGAPKRLVIQVKSGKVQSGQIRDLVGTMKREKATIGAFITLEPATRPMLTEAATAGFYEPEYFKGKRYPRLQILTIEDLLEGKELEYPRLAPADTFKRAGRVSKRPVETSGELF